jgi:MFS transporter, DHA2 family, multidrug resistance protein
MATTGSQVIGNVVEMQGRTDNVALRQAGMFALAVNVIFVLLAIVSITVTVPKGGGSRDLGKAAASPAPEPQLPPDEEKAALIARLSQLSLSELRQIEKQVMLEELGHVDPAVLKQLVETRRE